jgi:hypothetical protein
MDNDINPCGYSDEVRRGEVPAHKSRSQWMLPDGTLEYADCYAPWFGDFTVLFDTYLCDGEYRVNGTTFWVHGLADPIMKVWNSEQEIELDSQRDAPQLLADEFIKVFRKGNNRKMLENKFGRMFIEKMKRILEYKVPIEATEDSWILGSGDRGG